jgi:hypothetical protein
MTIAHQELISSQASQASLQPLKSLATSPLFSSVEFKQGPSQ